MKKLSFTDPRNKRPELHTNNTTPPIAPPQPFISRHFTGHTPEVILDKNIGTAFFFGRLLCSNPHDFFQPFIKWATDYIEAPQEVTLVTINTDYINTGSSKALLEFLRILSTVQYTGRKIIIKYYCDKGDDDTIELIENISSIIKVKIEIEQPK